jgi:hypothetical protein
MLLDVIQGRNGNFGRGQKVASTGAARAAGQGLRAREKMSRPRPAIRYSARESAERTVSLGKVGDHGQD